jgi:hypothetical protein
MAPQKRQMTLGTYFTKPSSEPQYDGSHITAMSAKQADEQTTTPARKRKREPLRSIEHEFAPPVSAPKLVIKPATFKHVLSKFFFFLFAIYPLH